MVKWEQTSQLRLVNATGFVRRMRGGSQACLLTTADGGMCVVKFRNNPQHLRTLVNEIIATLYANRIGISTPELCLVHIDKSLLSTHAEDLAIRRAHGSVPVQEGIHLGSCYPFTIEGPAVVYDLLPSIGPCSVMNLEEFVGVFVLDKWMANSDARQAIFVRMREPDHQGARFKTLMIDHGFTLGGSAWQFSDSPMGGHYHDRIVYSGVTSLADFEPWIERIRAIGETFGPSVMRCIPKDWIAGETRQVEALLERLMGRRAKLPRLIEDGRGCTSNPFPNWRSPAVQAARTSRAAQ